MNEKKPWWQSKIILFSGSLVAVFGTNLLNGWLTGAGVTPEQLEVLRVAYPDIAASVEKIKAGENILSALGISAGALLAIFRKWFTNKLLS